MGSQRKDLTGLFTSFTSNDPQVLVRIDREKAKALGVPFSQISDALQVYMGSEYVNNFDFNNRSYRVYVQADAAVPRKRRRHPPVLRALRDRPDDPAR